MSDDVFDQMARTARADGPAAAFALLATRLCEEKRYPQLFEARLMKKRWELGLPLVQTEPLGELPADTRRVYEEAYIAAAREVGGLFLADGEIERAWPYFRAIGETGPVAAAIESVEPGEGIDAIIEIAFHERANPRKGFELILANYGTCSAITTFEQYPAREGRLDCVRLLVRRLHADLTDNLRHAIAAREHTLPESRHVPTLVAGRDWLFEENNYHIDTSHLAAVVRFSIELDDRESLGLAAELTEYGRRLSPLFQYKGHAPFENIHEDYGAYLHALLGEHIERAIEHFREKAAAAGTDEAGTAPAQALVGLVSRLGRSAEALDLAVQHLRGVNPSQLACPSIAQLCELAGAHARLEQLARDDGDILHFTAAIVAQSKPR